MKKWIYGQDWTEKWLQIRIGRWGLKRMRASILQTYMGLYLETDETHQHICKKALDIDLPKAGSFYKNQKVNAEITRLIEEQCGIRWGIGSFYYFKEGDDKKQGYCKRFVKFLQTILELDRDELVEIYKKFASEINGTQFAGYSQWLDFEKDLEKAGYLKYLDTLNRK